MAKKEVDINLSVKGIHDLEKANEVLEKIKFEKKKIEAQADTLGRSVTKLAAAYVTVDKAVSFVKGSIEEFQKLEKANLKLEAASRAVGASFEQNKQKVAKLAEDGALAIGQVSDNFATLIKSGLDAQKAFDLIDASKKLGTFASATGNASDAVADLVNGLLTGEEQLFNIDPSLKQFAKSLGGGEKVAGDLATKMQFVNEVIRRGNELTADYAAAQDTASARAQRLNVSFTKLQATVGQKLAPAFNALALALSDTFNWLEKNVSAALDYIKLLPGLGQILRIFETIGEIQKDNQNAALAEQVEIMGKLDAVVRSGLASEETKAELLKKQGQLLGGLGDAYRKVFQEAQMAGKPLVEQVALLNQLKKEAAGNAGLSDTELANEISRLKLAESASRPRFDPILGAVGGATNVGADPDRLAALLEEQSKRTRSGRPGGVVTGGGGGAPKRSDFLLSGLTESLVQNQRALDAFTESIDGAGKAAEGAARKLELDTLAIQQASDLLQSYYKSNLQVELTAAEREYEAAQKLNDELIANRMVYADKSVELEEEYEKKKLNIQLKYAQESAQALAQVNSAAIQTIQAQSTGSTLTGVGATAGAVGGFAGTSAGAALGLGGATGSAATILPIAGIALGVAGAIFGAIEAADAEEEAKRKKRQAEIDQANERRHQVELGRIKTLTELVKIQLDLQNKLQDLANQERKYRTELANLDAKSQSEIIRNNLAASFASKRQSASFVGLYGDQDQQSGQAQDIIREGAISGATRATIRQLLSEFSANPTGGRASQIGRQLQSISDNYSDNGITYKEAEAISQVAQSMSTVGSNAQGARIRQEVAAAALGQVESAGGAQSAQVSAAENFLSSTLEIAELQSQLSTQKFADALALIERQAQAGGSAFDKTGALQSLASRIGKSLGITDLSTINADTAKLFGTAGADAENFQMLLDLMEQIKDATKETAENTATTLTDRQLTFSDIGRGGRVSGGLFETLDSLSFRVPSGIQSVAVATGAAGGGGNPQLADISANTRAAAQLLGDIAAQLRAGNVVSIESLIRQGIANANGGNTL